MITKVIFALGCTGCVLAGIKWNPAMYAAAVLCGLAYLDIVINTKDSL